METFDGIKFTVKGSAKPVPESEVAAAEEGLSCRFPPDYRRFVMKYGAGFFLRLPIVIFPPRKIAASTEADQHRLRDHWFWDGADEVLSQEDGVRTIACFDTDIGVDIRFLPEDASVMFVFSHDDDTITRCGSFKEIVRLLDPDCKSHIYEFRALIAA